MKKKLVSMLSAAMFIFNFIAPCELNLFAGGKVCAANAVWNGETDTQWYQSTENNFSISTAEELAGLAELVNSGVTFQNKTIEIEEDIVLNDGDLIYSDGKYSFSGNTANKWIPIGTYKSSSSKGFRGIFNGNGHVVSGMYINSSEQYQGLFGISGGCTIDGVKLKNSIIVPESDAVIGGLIAGVQDNIGSTVVINIENCSSDVIIADEVSENITAGGIVGSGYTKIASRNITINVSDCCFLGQIALGGTNTTAGGIIGKAARKGDIANCYNAGAIEAGVNSAGVCAVTRDFTNISKCFNSGSIRANAYAGGIVGNVNSDNSISYSYNVGKIEGKEGSGGIIANNQSLNIEKCINNYYLSDSAAYAYKYADSEEISASGKAESAQKEFMQSTEFVNKLNADGDESFIFLNDDTNGGYPMLKKIYYSELYHGKYQVTSPVISGNVFIGGKLKAEYEASGDENAIKLIETKWYISETENGTFKHLSDDGSIDVTEDIFNKYVKVVLELPTGEKLESDIFRVCDTEFDGKLNSVSISGILNAGQPLTFSYTGTGVIDADIIKQAWYICDSENGNFTLCTTDKKCLTEDIESDRYYKLELTLKNGNTYMSPTVKINKMLYSDWDYPTETYVPALNNARADTNEEYKFVVGGQEFILLDYFKEADTMRYKVMTECTYGTYKFSALPIDMILAQLPEEISTAIEKDAHFNGSFTGWMSYQNTMTGIGSPSVKDLIDYRDIIGVKTYNIDRYNKNGAIPVMFGTNSMSKKTGAICYAIGTDKNGNVTVNDECNCFEEAAAEIRPVFYLDKEFFKNSKTLDTSAIGKKVLEAICDNNAKEEMMENYNRKTVESIFGYKPDYEIKSIICTDTSGNKMEMINSFDFTVNVNVLSSVQNKKARLLVCLYEDNKLIKAASEDFSLPQNAEKVIKIPISNMNCSGNVQLLAAVLEGADKLLPVIEQKKF